MRIYLGGKIASDDWRTKIVAGLEEAVKDVALTAKPWPILKDSIHGIHDYTGPFFTKVDKTSGDILFMHPKVHEMCMRAIDASDLVYAWIDDPTCYATLFELGYAKKAGKYVVIGYPPNFAYRHELWFMDASATTVVETRRPDLGLVSVVLDALRSGVIPHVDEELKRIQENLASIQRMGPIGPDEVKEARRARGQHVPNSSGHLANPPSIFPPERVTARTLVVPEANDQRDEQEPPEGDDRG